MVEVCWLAGISSERFPFYLQNITNNADTPHVRAEADGIEIDHLWGDKLGCAEEDLHLFLGIVFARQAKVNKFDAISGARQAHDVLGLEVQMEDGVAVNELHGLTDLPDKHHTGTFGQYEVIANDAVEQLTALDSARQSQCVGGLVNI